MSDKKTYYYLKLKEDFFESDDMKLLQANVKDGYLYSDILMKLYLKSLRTEGRLMYRGVIPYTPEMLATLTGHTVGTVEKAVKYFQKVGMLEILDNGAIYMMDIQNFIGRSSNEADRIRDYRNTIKAEKERISDNSDATKDVQMYDESTPENRDKENRDKENRDKENICSEQDSEQPETPFITLTLNTREEYPFYEKDIEEYKALYPAVDVEQEMRNMKGWCKENPTKRKTKRGIRRFVNGWLAREQDNGGKRSISTKTASVGQYMSDTAGW